jgi:hypothetical protein
MPASEVKHLPACDSRNIPGLPTISFLAPPEKQLNPYDDVPMSPNEHRMKGELSLDSLRRALEEYAPAFHSKVNSRKQLLRFLNDSTIPTKIILLTNNNTIPLWFRGISSYFRHRLEVPSSSTSSLLGSMSRSLNYRPSTEQPASTLTY